jgi:hypothetical protein
MADWLATDPTDSGDSDTLIIGDLNAYAKEDPIAALQSGGYTDLVAQFGGASAYGYVFDGQLGYLDHALANDSLQPQVAGVAEWHINADEIPLFDYNDDARTADEATFEEESDSLPLYEPNEFRTSDHDPVIVGLNLINDAPVADNQSVTTDEDTSTALTLSASDAGSASLAYTVLTTPAHGTLSGTAPNLSYTPDADFNGEDSFTFKVNDGHSDSNIATVSIIVNAVNDAPVAVADSATTRKGSAVHIDVLANDTDVDGNDLTITSWTKGAQGSVRLVDGRFRYGPKEGFRGTDTFTYTISDGNGGTATGTVTVTVTKK